MRNLKAIRYYKEDDFHAMVRKLNALCGSSFEWNYTQARKRHEDHFGEMIERGDIYFKRDLGGSFGNELKLSYDSMERLLFAVFASNFSLQRLAERIIEDEIKELRESVNKINFG
jgi:hypothetical protein